MLHDRDIIAHVATALEALGGRVPVVLDPVLVSSSGANLIAPDAVIELEDRLFPLATLITPNLPELELITECELRTTDLMERAAGELAREYGANVLAKGGHTDDARVIDILVAPDGTATYFAHERVDTRHTHGTGCTLSAAIATLLGHGLDLEQAVRLAREFVLRAILAAPGYGAGNEIGRAHV